MENWARVVLGVLVAALAAWTAVENMESYAFRKAGKRCNDQRCSWIEQTITRNVEEDLRLQLQIDTLEEQVRELTEICIREIQ